LLDKHRKPERREGKIRTKHAQSENKSFDKKERSVRTSRPNHDPKTWLRDQYTNDDQVMVCQMCANEMPFKLKDGSYHFEAVQVSDHFLKENHALSLALCPLCAAMYRFLVKRDSALLDNFLTSIRGAEKNLEIPIELGINGFHTISFVETHLQDLKTILNYANELAV
jgi:hypothetical protein